MTEKKGEAEGIDVKALLASDDAFIRAVVRAALQEVLGAEMMEALRAGKGERTTSRVGCRSGYYGRTLITRAGKLELKVPQDRDGRFPRSSLSAQRAGAGGGLGGDVRTRSIDAEAQSDH